MTNVVEGFRILEVAEQTFAPAAAALLADWGAQVIKVEHVERGDAMRGLGAAGAIPIPKDVHPIFESTNRGKRSIGLNLASPQGRDVLLRLVSQADVFLTNKLPAVQRKLKITVDDIRAVNPQIVYVRATGQGSLGPDADRGAYDALAFWARSGIGATVSRPEYGGSFIGQPGAGFGDSLGALAIAGGIMGALLHRERGGAPQIVDVSLLAMGLWAMAQPLALALLDNQPAVNPMMMIRNPLVHNYGTKDSRYVALICLQAGKYWPELCKVIGHPELATDARFGDHQSLVEHSAEAIEILDGIFVQRTVREWRDTLAPFSGQWAAVQDLREAADDPQTLANGYIQDCESARGVPFRVTAAPIQFDGRPTPASRAPEFNEHCEAIMHEAGFTDEDIINLKINGAVA